MPGVGAEFSVSGLGGLSWLPGSGVRAASRSRRLLRIMRPVDGGGPGVVAMLLAPGAAPGAPMILVAGHGAPPDGLRADVPRNSRGSSDAATGAGQLPRFC